MRSVALITTAVDRDPLLSWSAKADHPVITVAPAFTGSSAFADDDKKVLHDEREGHAA
jgi:hypothetical protein